MTKPYLKIRIIIADDHEMVREGFQLMISKIDELELVGEASNGEQLIHLTRRLRPDVLLVDIKMPKYSGIEATQIIKQELPHIGVVALSSYDEQSLILDMLNAGAKGYLLKNASKQEITEAVKTVYRDESYYCRDINLKLAQMVAKGGLFTNTNVLEFSEKELQIIELICEEYSSKQIAAALKLRTRTVQSYRDTIMQKMEVKNMAGLVIYAVRNGIYNPDAKKK